ncbi:hypothetical protein NKH77_05785 [Streptomyces sp. M19]
MDSDTATGRAAVDHPLLGTAVELAGADGTLHTGTLSSRDLPWLADHAVGGVVLLPGTAFVEMALAAGARVGCGLVEELTIAEPLVLPADGSVRVQCTVGEPDGTGARAFQVYSASADGEPWTTHATGVLGTGPPNRRPSRWPGRRPAPNRWTWTAPTTASPSWAPSTARRSRAARRVAPGRRGVRRGGDPADASAAMGVHPRCSTPRCTRSACGPASPSG